MKRIISLIAITGFFIMTSAFAHAAEPEQPNPSALAITPDNPSIPVGAIQQFTATGTYSDGTIHTTQVTWSSSETKVATIDSTTGLATAVSAGSTTITATRGSILKKATLTVNSETLSSLAVTPDNPSIPVGAIKRFTATGTYSDGTPHTTQVTWSSSETKVATIDSTTGLATAVSAGSTTITATRGSILKKATLTVNSETLSSLAVTTIIPGIPAGVPQRFTATGTYSDGTIHTTQVTWSSSNPKVATVDSTGLVTAVSAGSTTITATSGSILGNADLTVPPEQALKEGVEQAIKLKANGFSESDIMEILLKNPKYKFGWAELTTDQKVELRKSFSEDFIKNWVGVPQYVTIGASAIYLVRDNNMVGAGVVRIFFFPRSYYIELNSLPWSVKAAEDKKCYWQRFKYNINPDNRDAWIHRVALNLGLTSGSGTETSNSDNFFLLGLSYELTKAAQINVGWAAVTTTQSGSRGQIYVGITLDSNVLKVLGIMK
jgi:uncharacterized protein YjdB